MRVSCPMCQRRCGLLSRCLAVLCVCACQRVRVCLQLAVESLGMWEVGVRGLGGFEFYAPHGSAVGLRRSWLA